MQRNIIERNIRQRHHRPRPTHRRPSPQVVELVVRQIDIHIRSIILRDGADEHGIPKKPLQVEGVGVRVGGVEEEERVQERGARGALGVQGRVEVVEQAVADRDGGLGGGSHERPAVEFLTDRAEGVVVAVEGVKGAEHGPAGAEGGVGVLGVAADVAFGGEDGQYRFRRQVTCFVRDEGCWVVGLPADHGDLEERCEVQHALDGVSVVFPV